MYFRRLEQGDLTEIKNLHKEWFPLNYPQSFYDKVLLKPKIIPLGCFISIPVGSMGGDDLSEVESGNEGRRKMSGRQKRQQYYKEIILGSVISRVKQGKDDIADICNFEADLKFRSDSSFLYYYASKLLWKPVDLCRDNRRHFAHVEACYIMTLGIVDECRFMGLGSQLLAQTY
mmetsp:Transcript_10087/g.17018  ORF Transcript_10087/g.17018 Transcript_10087/m.17018 type:complete len:174 (+) Transcript_10087:413-934(+)